MRDGGHKKQSGRESPPGSGSSGSVCCSTPKAMPHLSTEHSPAPPSHTAWQGGPVTLPPLSPYARFAHTGQPFGPAACPDLATAHMPRDRRVLCCG